MCELLDEIGRRDLTALVKEYILKRNSKLLLKASSFFFNVDTIDYITRIGSSSHVPIELLRKIFDHSVLLDHAFFLLKIMDELGLTGLLILTLQEVSARSEVPIRCSLLL